MAHVLFVGGASIGHIAPSLAVMQQLVHLLPEVKCHFVCLPKQTETDYLEQNRCAFSTIDSPRFSLSFPWKFLRAYRQASALLSELKPSVVFSKGGHVSVPVCLAAKRRGIPIVLHESDAVSGYANRIVGKWATTICTGFPSEKTDRRHVHTGNPIRQETACGRAEEGLRITGFSGKRPVLLVMGGSQGAQALNEALIAHIQELLEVCDVIHLTGHGKTGASVADTRYFRREFVYGELPHLYAIASLALSRAGANALSELAANGIPTIVVPLRGVGHDHQQANAKRAATGGGCILLDQSELDNKIVPLVKYCLQDKTMRESMSESMRNLFFQEASLQIAKILSKFLAQAPGSH